MPFVSQRGNTLDSDVVLGGIERFQQLIYQNFNGKDGIEIIPVAIPKKDRINSSAKNILKDALVEHHPHMILTNSPNISLSLNLHKMVKQYGLSMIHVHHEPLERSMMIMGVCKNLIEMKKLGVDIYMVSENQFNFYNENCRRLSKGKDDLLDSNGDKIIKGYINPAFADENAHPSKSIYYDVCTIGRNISSKDPFWIHRKLEKTKLTTMVMTSGNVVYKSKANNKYVEENKKWDAEEHEYRITEYGLSHKENMTHVSNSSVFISTWQLESWGITALEALSHGIPTILLTDSSGDHASEHIAAHPDHIIKLKKSSSKKEIVAAIEKLKKYTHQERVEISETTKEKHSKEKWIKDIGEKIIDKVHFGKEYPFKSENG